MSTSEKTYSKIADEQLAMCLRDPNLYVECLVKYSSIRGLMHLIYIEYISTGKIIPIEKLPEKNRREIWVQAQKDGAGRLNKSELIALSRVMYLIDCLLLQWELNQK